jgi:DeoR/GlpR family transcriptional regulator of sugar metabolism
MIQEERLVQIKKMLKKEHQVSTKEIAKKFGVSFDFLARNQVQSPVKLKMAKMAKRFIHPGQCDFIGPSTTLKQLCPMLNGMDIQVVTNSIDNALSLLTSEFPSVRLLGGID